MASLEQTHLVGGFYRLLDSIGTGGMGIVYKAQDVRTDQIVAIKLLKPSVAEYAPELIARFRREGDALRQLNHPNIVKVHDTFEENNHYYLVLEYVSGGSLADLLKREGRLPADEVLQIALGVADALTRTHQLRIIHRDLKPGNVLLAEDGTPRLTDFGIAHISNAERLTDKGLIVGTADYLSPESFHGIEANVYADIWAFGVLLFEMLVGQRPFTGKTFAQIIMGIIQKPTPDLEALCPDAPIALIDLIYRMLAKDPQERIHSVRLIAAELEAISQGVLMSAHRPAPMPKAGDDPTTLIEYTPSDPQIIPNNLPTQTTAFIGREAELSELAKLLGTDDVRLVTILAPGGMGKTRLSLKMAQGQLDNFANGVFFVSLAPLSSPEGIVPAIAEAVKFSFYGPADPKQQILDFLRKKHMLLVLDNFEHLIEGATLVAEILQAAPKVKILATSRSKLNLQEEHLFRIEGMDFPDWETPADALEYSAVKLFLQSARRVEPNFVLTEDDLTYLARICRQVEGMPLGILIAAAWVDALSLAEISAEIDRSLSFLETEHQNLPTRQRSIYAVFDYSWNLLSDEEREVFPKLSVFRGGFTRDAAEKVAGATLRTLAALVSKSMLKRNPQSGRYDIHELLRQYAEQQLVNADELFMMEEAHANFFAHYLQQRWEDLKGRKQLGALAEINADFENIRNSWRWLIEQQRQDELADAVNSLTLYLQITARHFEAFDLFTYAVNTLRLSREHWLMAHLIGQLAGFQVLHGLIEESRRNADHALAILEAANRPIETLMVLFNLSSISNASGDLANTAKVGEQALQIAQNSDDEWIKRRALQIVGAGLNSYHKDYPEARRTFEECVALAKSAGDVLMIADVDQVLAYIAIEHHDFDDAERYSREGLQAAEILGHHLGIRNLSIALAVSLTRQGKRVEAKAYFSRGIKITSDDGIARDMLVCTLTTIEEYFFYVDQPFAVELLSMILHHPACDSVISGWTEKTIVLLKRDLLPEEYESAWQRGAKWSLSEATALLLERLS